MRDPKPNPWPGNANAYECPWGCNGTGSMPWFAHIQGGICFSCKGDGWILGRGNRAPAPAPAPAPPRRRRQWQRVGSQLVEIT
jgi:hypothetical protein